MENKELQAELKKLVGQSKKGSYKGKTTDWAIPTVACRPAYKLRLSILYISINF